MRISTIAKLPQANQFADQQLLKEALNTLQIEILQMLSQAIPEQMQEITAFKVLKEFLYELFKNSVDAAAETAETVIEEYPGHLNILVIDDGRIPLPQELEGEYDIKRAIESQSPKANEKDMLGGFIQHKFPAPQKMKKERH